MEENNTEKTTTTTTTCAAVFADCQHLCRSVTVLLFSSVANRGLLLLRLLTAAVPREGCLKKEARGLNPWSVLTVCLLFDNQWLLLTTELCSPLSPSLTLTAPRPFSKSQLSSFKVSVQTFKNLSPGTLGTKNFIFIFKYSSKKKSITKVILKCIQTLTLQK